MSSESPPSDPAAVLAQWQAQAEELLEKAADHWVACHYA